MKKISRKDVCKILSVIVILAIVVILADTGTIRVQAAKNKNTVVLYFSATGTTKGAAKKIKKNTKGRMVEIKAAEPYTEDDLDYNDDNSRTSKENASANSPAESTVRPEISNLKAIKKAVKNADVVYIGYPIWWGEAPHIMYTLVENVSLKGKTVVPFCTSASSRIGNSAGNLKDSADISSKTTWMKGRNFYDVPSQKTVDRWIKGLKY